MSVAPLAGFLSGYCVLDLTDHRGWPAGKLLADLGAQVLKIEPPGGDPGRGQGPFYRDQARPEGSLPWLAHNAGKQGLTLDLTRPQGRELFLRLVDKADAVVESFDPGYLDGLGLGFEALGAVKPGLVYAALSPFGPAGPYRDLQVTDLTLWALSGLLFICGDPDRPPLRISLPQAFLHASVDLATGTVMALYHRGRTGQGQRVDVSALQALERVAYIARNNYLARGKILRRPGSGLKIPPLGTTTPLIWPCRDGYVAFYLFGGAMGAVSNPALTAWLAEEGLATETMLAMDWPKFNIGRTPQEEIDREIVGPIALFFKRHSRAELWAGGVKRRVMVYPVNDAAAVLADGQLKERGFWVELVHEELGASLAYPGPFVRTEASLCRVRGRAPRIGEHNREVYQGLLDLGPAELADFKAQGVI